MTERTRNARTQTSPLRTEASWPALTQSAHGSNAARVVRTGTQSGGVSLDRRTRNEMSAKFGHDFSSVRIHTDSHAAESAAALGANAFTLGSDIVFGAGQYTPSSPLTDRLLAHELTHVVQQSQLGDGDMRRTSRKSDASEREAESVASRIQMGQHAEVQAAPDAGIARDEDSGGFFSSLVSDAGSALSAGWQDTKSAAGAVYDGYEKATDFKSLQSGNAAEADKAKGQWGESFIRGGINGEIDSFEKMAEDNNQKMVDDAQGHWYSGLAKGSAWLNNGITEATGGLAKGVGDIGFGLANTLAHPVDAAGGIEGFLEHNSTMPFLGSTLKAGHGAYDLLSGKKNAEYGDSWGELANHVFNPLQQSEDDAKYDTALATSIIAPDKNKDGSTDWSAWKDKPVEAATRALTNIAPIALGVGEIAGATDAGEVGNMTKVVEPPSSISPKATTIEMPAVRPVEPATPISPKATTIDMSAQPGPIGDPPVNPFGKTDPAIPAQPPMAADPVTVPTDGKTLVDPDFSKGAVPGMPWWDPAPPAGANWAKQLEWGLRQYEPGGIYYSEPLPSPPRVPEPTVSTQPSISRNPVQQMPAVDPSQVYPGAPQPPGWQAGPVSPVGFPADAPASTVEPLPSTLPELPPTVPNPFAGLF